MSEADKDMVQHRVLEELERFDRRAFRGPIALRLRLRTTEKTPTHSHHIAKNLLDLFGRPRASLATRRHALLYADDHQVHALAVTCRHGESEPMIALTASPLRSLLNDLDLAREHAHERRDPYDERGGRLHLERAVDNLMDLMDEEADFRNRWGDQHSSPGSAITGSERKRLSWEELPFARGIWRRCTIIQAENWIWISQGYPSSSFSPLRSGSS